MKKFFSLFILSLIFISTLSSVKAEEGYQPLADIPGVTQDVNTTGKDGLGNYLKAMYQLGVGLATILAVMMVIWGGVEYVSTDAIGGKEEGKERIQNALLGLLLALGSYLILRTISPDLLKTNLQIDPLRGLRVVPLDIPKFADIPNEDSFGDPPPGFIEQDNYDDQDGTVPSEGGSNSIVDMPSNVPVKAGAGKQIDLSLSSKLSSFADNLSSQGIEWTVTEGYPPSREHKANCHQLGTCVDANFRGSSRANGSTVNSFISAASSSGLRAVYEVKSEADRERLINEGVPPENVKNLGDWISAPHFSVYHK